MSTEDHFFPFLFTFDIFFFRVRSSVCNVFTTVFFPLTLYTSAVYRYIVSKIKNCVTFHVHAIMMSKMSNGKKISNFLFHSFLGAPIVMRIVFNKKKTNFRTFSNGERKIRKKEAKKKKKKKL